jgi:hypothetical protein
MSAAAATAAAPKRPSPLAVYRDDGPLAAALARVGRAVPLPAPALAAPGALAILAAIAVERDGASDALAGAAIAIAVVLGALAGGRPEAGGFRWLVPAAVRLAEYAGLLWLGSLAGASGEPAAFALIAALAFRHYDLVYRLRHRSVTPPAWVNLLGLGWDGRLVLGYVLLLAGVLPTAFFVLAAVMGVVFVAESVAGWTSATTRTSVYEEEEDEGQ